MNKIYLLFACDIWKSHASMRLLMATTIRKTIDDLICEKLCQRDMRYGGQEGESAVDCYLDSKNPDCLEYGYLETVHDGEKR